MSNVTGQVVALSENACAVESTLASRKDGARFYDAPTKDRIGQTLLWATVVALAVRLLVIAFVYQGFLDPGRDHWEFGYEMGKIAHSIATGHGFGNPYEATETGPTAVIAPVFPYLVAGVFRVFGIYTKASAIVILSLNSLFSALTCIPIFFLAKRSFGLRTARWAAWAWAFFPYAINFSANSMWEHPLSALFLTWLFLIALHLERSTRLWAWVGFGLLWGVAALTSPIVLGVLPIIVGWACYRLHRHGRNWMLPAGTTLLVTLLAITPWLVRNYRTFHHPMFLRTGFPLVFCIGNVGDTLHWYNPLDPPGNPAAMAEVQRNGEYAYMAARSREMLDFLRTHPGIFWRRSVRRAVFMWTGYWSFRPEYLREEPWDPPNILLCTPLTLLALLGLRRAFRSGADTVLPYALLLLSFPVAYYFTIPSLSYRQPIDPEVVILSTYAVVSWFEARGMRRSQRLSTVASV